VRLFSPFDIPMSLGDHLEDLRKRLVWPILIMAILFIAGFAMQGLLKRILIKPLQWAIEIVGPEVASQIGMKADSTRLLQAFDLSESTMLSMSVAFDAALVLTFPILIYQLWKFVSVGLKTKEKELGFLFVPLGVIFFYLGACIGYFIGLPYFFVFLINWHVADPTAERMVLGMTLYHGFFVNMTICFGLIMDIPWLVIVLVRVGLVTVDQLVKWRKMVVVINLIAAAAITPTSDAYSLMAIAIPMQLLFELGLLVSRLLVRRTAAGETL